MTRFQKLKRRIKNAPLSYYVVLSLIMVTLYTIVALIISIMYGMTNDTLTTCWFATWGGETLTCGLIKLCKIKEKDNGME